MACVLTSSRLNGLCGDPAPRRELSSFDKALVFVFFFRWDRVAVGHEGVDPRRQRSQPAQVVVFPEPLDDRVEVEPALVGAAEAGRAGRVPCL